MASETSDKMEGWTNQVLVYIALTLGLILLVKYLLSSRPPHNIPPFPAKPYPIMGHLPYFKNGMKKQMEKWTESTGDIFSLYFGPKLVIILNSYEVVYQAFVKHADTLSDRPKTLAANAAGEDPNRGIVTASGRVWKEQRTVALHILRAFGMGKNVLAVKVSEEVSAYLQTLSDFGGEPKEVKFLTKTAVSNIICSIIVGKRFDYDDTYFIKFINKLDLLFRLTQSSSLFTIFPWLRYVPGDLFNAKKRTSIYRYIMDFFCYHYIEKTKREDTDFNCENFISAYLREKQRLEQQGQETSLDDENLARVLFNLFLAGTDTTSTAITWFMLYMLHYPELQAKIFSEITEVVGLEKGPDMYDRSKLNLTVATIMEVQRVSSVPLNLPHQCSEDTVIKGHTIPAGTTVFSNINSVLMSTHTWKDPEKFNPGRFLDAQGVLNQPDQFIPFGIGRRACPGESLAKMELFLFLSSMIQRFELRPAVPGQLPTLKPVEGLIYSPQPCQIRFVDRRHV